MIGFALNLIGIAGLAIAGFGVFLVTQAVSRNEPARGGVLLIVVGVVIAAVFFIMSAGVIEIQAQEVGVVFNVLSGSLSDEPLGPGLHIIIPGIQEVTIYSTAQQEYTVSGVPGEGAIRGDDAITALTEDGQNVSMDVTLIYSVDPAKAQVVHKRWQNRYVNSLIRPALRSAGRDAINQFTVEQIYGGERTALINAAQVGVRELIEPEGFLLSNVLIRNISFSPEYVASIERKQVAQQEALEAEFRVEQKRQEAEQDREEARGRADAVVIAAEGEAEGLRLINEQLAQNPLLLQWSYIENLSDDIEIVIIPSNSPYLFDLQSLTQQADISVGGGNGTSGTTDGGGDGDTE